MVAKKSTRKVAAKSKTSAKSKVSAKAKSVSSKKASSAKKVVSTRKVVTAKRSTKSTVKAVASKKTVAIKTPFSKTQMQSAIAEACDLSKKQVTAVFEELGMLIERHIKTRGAGEFTLPGMLKVKVVRKPATKSRKGINPFTGEETVFKAKPARNVVKIKPLKKLKDMAA